MEKTGRSEINKYVKGSEVCLRVRGHMQVGNCSLEKDGWNRPLREDDP